MCATAEGQPLSLTQAYFHDIILAEGFDPSWQHVGVAVHTARQIEPDRAAEVVAALQARHALLGARLTYRDEEPRLVAARPQASATIVLDMPDATPDELDVELCRAIDAPFDLLAGPLWRVVVARGPGGRTTLAFACHHLVGDVISTWILLRDFGVLYFGVDPDPAGEPYAAFAAHQRALHDAPPAADLAYWNERLDGARPLLAAARRPPDSEFAAAAVEPLPCERIEAEALVAKAREARVTPLSLLTAMTLAGIRRATGQADLVCGILTDVRGSRFATTVGPFSEIMFVRERDGEADERARLAALRNAFFAGWRHHLPIALLRERVASFRGGAPNPCDIFLNFVPIATSSDWQRMVGPFEDPSLRFHPFRHRNPAPTRRMLGPLYFFNYMHEQYLYGSVVVRRSEPLAALNRAVAEAVAGELSTLAAAASTEAA
jgi:Condensation domain